MRKSKINLIGLTPEGPFAGISLQYMHHGEQDSYGGLFNLFGIDREITSKEKSDYLIKTVPDKILYNVHEDRGILVVGDNNYTSLDLKSKNLRFRDLYFNDTEEVAVAWDSSSFGLLIRDKDNLEWLEELYQAILRKDIIICPTGGSYYIRPNLEILIYSKHFPAQSFGA